TTSAFFALAVVMFTVTGAWSRVPAAPGSVSVTITGIVALLPDPDATVPTEETVPGAGPPGLPITWLTRSACGSNTTCPRGSDPDGEEMPSADCSLATPAAV